MEEKRIIVGSMEPREKLMWTDNRRKQDVKDKRLRRNRMLFAAVFLCVMVGAGIAITNPRTAQMVMSHVSAGFEYDDTLGRLQFVSNILPESAMVFLESVDTNPCINIVRDSKSVKHSWSEEEPWIEYANVGEVFACDEGQVASIIENHAQEYTVRILHAQGCESIYSGLKTILVNEDDFVQSGEQIGTAAGVTAFEWRKEGLSVLPVFRNEI